MSVKATTHLNFRGDARAALGLYHSVFGGTVTVVTYADAGAVQDPAEADQVMWGQVEAENGFRVMAFDMPSSRPWSPGESPFYLALRVDSAEELTRFWKGLSEGATILQPLEPAPWSPLYGMLVDRFGVTWVADLEVEQG